MLGFLKKPKPIKTGARALYKRSGEVVVVKEHKMPNQVTVVLSKGTSAYNDFKYMLFVQKQNVNMLNKFLHEGHLEVTISIDELEVLPDKDIAELLY